MSMFVVRVELHFAIEANYDTLHQAMRAAGFTTTIPAADGVQYQLPPAQYFADTNDSWEQVLNVAKTAASRTGRAYGVIVTEGNSYWSGLTPV